MFRDKSIDQTRAAFKACENGFAIVWDIFLMANLFLLN